MSSPRALEGAAYVAMGSSFAAGPGLGQRAPKSARLCGRSNDNYAHLLARMRGLQLTDVSCSGATARQLLEGGPFRQPPQVNALRPETALVTVTAGGNDISYIGNLLAWSRQDAPQRTPLFWRLVLPRPTPDEVVDRALEGLPAVLTRIADEVRRRSPHATLVFVDYATVLPDVGASDTYDGVPLREEHLRRGRYVAQQLTIITAQVAVQTSALLVRASEVTHGHDACAADPWMEGYNLPTLPFKGGLAAYHPNACGMRAVAQALDAALPTQSQP